MSAPAQRVPVGGGGHFGGGDALGGGDVRGGGGGGGGGAGAGGGAGGEGSPSTAAAVREEERRLATSVCERCGEPGVLADYARAFDVLVCRRCTKEDPERYELLPKGQARDEYVLSDRDLAPLRTLRRGNPRNHRWADLRLYIRVELARVQARKHGSAARAHAKRDAADAARAARDAKRRRREETRPAREAAAAAMVQAAEKAVAHEHTYGEAVSAHDPANEDLMVKTCTVCGFECRFEQL